MGGSQSAPAPPAKPKPSVDRYYDQYRQIGYLINEEETEDAGRNSWRVFAKNDHLESIDDAWVMIAEFYITPTNVHFEDIKISLNNGIIKGYKLTDIKSMPPQLEIDHPQLNKGPYKFVELPKREFSSRFYI